METQSSVKNVIPEIGGNFTVDESIIAVLPKGAKVLGASSYGTSAWTRTARINIELDDGTPKSYFLKVRQMLASFKLKSYPQLWLPSWELVGVSADHNIPTSGTCGFVACGFFLLVKEWLCIAGTETRLTVLVSVLLKAVLG